jgi:hypothetical protein
VTRDLLVGAQRLNQLHHRVPHVDMYTYVKCLLYTTDFNKNLNMPTNVRKSLKYKISYKNRPEELELFHAD